MPTASEAIQAFLSAFTHTDLADLYNHGMEVQVNVAQDDGEPISQKSGYTGRIWRGYTDGIQTWKPFRIPWNANSSPEYTDSNLNWDLSQHAEGIGMTGWCWEQCVSKWVAFDFDDLTSHNEGLTASELKEVQEAASNIPWVTVRKSTGGQGLHLYVFLNDIPTANHSEHSALSRAILGKMTAFTGFEFSNKVDICGGNIWVWHRKMKGTNGLQLIKQGETLYDFPINWKDHIPVINGQRRKTIPGILQSNDISSFERLTTERPRVKLDSEHKRLLEYLEEIDAMWWYDSDRNILVCHTSDLKKAHDELNFRGLFETVATGKEKHDYNSFLHPEEYPSGAWAVRRFTPGIQEANTWSQDSSGWTRCYLNKEPTLSVAARAFDGIEDERGNYFFNEAEIATAAAQRLGANLNLPAWAGNRQTIIKSHKDGRRIIVEVKREQSDNPSQMAGWKEDKGWWKKIFDARLSQPEATDSQAYDDIIRHLITTSQNDTGWAIKAGNKWQYEPLNHVKIALKAMGLSEVESTKAIGKCVMESWVLVNKPFEDEYPGNREWNKDAVQLQYVPSKEGPFVHTNWDKLINHCGTGLDEAVRHNGWCQANGVLNGGDYLRLWIASVFQFPQKHLPYLFLYSPEQQTGKTSFHEALKLLITSNGYMDIKAAMLNSSGFNEEMKSAVICAVDEMDLRQNKYAYNRIKDWITSEDILIHPKGKTPYMIKNVTHFIHTGNDPNECPIQTNDSRIIVIRVPPLNPMEMIPESVFKQLLDKEAAAFLGTLFQIEIPPCQDRLNLPVIETEEKDVSMKMTRNSFEVFLDEYCFYSPGYTVRYSELWTQFQNWLDTNEVAAWSKIRMGRCLPLKYPKGRLAADNAQFHVGNLSFTKPTEERSKYVLRKEMLVKEDEQ